jgi:hypothetical protein
VSEAHLRAGEKEGSDEQAPFELHWRRAGSRRHGSARRFCAGFHGNDRSKVKRRRCFSHASRDEVSETNAGVAKEGRGSFFVTA